MNKKKKPIQINRGQRLQFQDKNPNIERVTNNKITNQINQPND
jgi:hypothetical protein